MNKEVRIDHVALVLQGGGARGAFTAGVLDVFMEHGLDFSYVIGTSAGALNAVNYLSRDIGRSKKVTTEVMLDPKFCSFRNFLFRGGAFNFAYLFHALPKTSLPFDAGTYNASTARFFCVSTSLETGEVAYFQKGECREFYKALSSSASLPLIARPVRVLGKKYLDGGVVAPVPYKKPLEDGFEKFVMVMTRPRGYRRGKSGKLSRFLGWLFYRRYRGFYANYKKANEAYNDGYIAAEKMESEGKAVVIYPPENIHVGRMEKKTENLNALYQAGRLAGEENLSAILALVGAKHE